MPTKRKGIASVLAMLYLTLFATLAVGFAEATVMSAQISKNQRSLYDARFAADAGMSFIRYQLGSITVPPLTTQSGLLDAVATQLGNVMNGTGNMSSPTAHTVQNTSGVIYVPSASDWIPVDNATGVRFRATITQVPNTYTLAVSITGCGTTSTVCRAIQIQYQQALLSGAIFNYGVATKGSLQSSNTLIVNGPAGDMSRGGVLIASANSAPLKNTGTGSGFSGDLWYTNAAGTNKYTGLTLDGLSPSDPSFASHVHAGATAPPFPTVDATVFQPYVNRTYANTSGGVNQTLTNTALAPGNYNFSGTTTIQGVLYIKTPSTINFSGPVTIQGAIVVENNPQGTSATNSLSFTNTVSASPMASLPSTTEFPDAERALTGSVLLAPNFSVTATNTFGTVCGSMIAGKFSFTNAFTATFNGSLVQLDDTPMTFSNTGNITINPLPSNYLPAGVTFGAKYVPSQGTYIEVTP